jgi:hypothetical protein
VNFIEKCHNINENENLFSRICNKFPFISERIEHMPDEISTKKVRIFQLYFENQNLNYQKKIVLEVKENDVSNRASKQRSILFERIYFYVN